MSFLLEPHGRGIFLPILRLVLGGSGLKPLPFDCVSRRKCRYAPTSPAAICSMIFSRGTGSIVAQGRVDAGITSLRDASEKENAMAFEFGPPYVDKPTDELLGEVLQQAGRPKEAQAAFQAAQTRAPCRTQSLVGLCQSLRAAGDSSGSAS